MHYTIEDLIKLPIWQHFYAISQIPRPSGRMDAITDYIEGVGKSLRL